MQVSLDLRIEQVPGDNGAGEWLRIDEEPHRECNALTRALALMVHGRVYYEVMEEYQPRAREDASPPDVLRAGTDGSVSVGGAALATQLLRAGLLDELLLFTHPAILGFGRPLFDDYDVPIDLDLLEQRSFKQGVTTHRYAIRDAKETGSC
ncbi:dihydrofolate reductase family protein [Nonomuraea angiospora]|uniref:Bacterial bifunctional deaminase-reductase C-terminal domain-containing protein n=1 Tax=Nonomuraea angiospora TaxID=46172 RepID=A0ABR9MKA5_9ACTN|nr:dihydrofolate reductase family protein [Nonomuraea angiospora]MBE1593359.1 hypothetical protein [Nonomuraea angiospora]